MVAAQRSGGKEDIDAVKGILLTVEDHASFFLYPNEDVFEERWSDVRGYRSVGNAANEDRARMNDLYEPRSILLLWDGDRPCPHAEPRAVKFGDHRGPEIVFVPLGWLVEERKGQGQRRTRFVVLWEPSQKQIWLAFDYYMAGATELDVLGGLNEPYQGKSTHSRTWPWTTKTGGTLGFEQE